MYLFSRILIPWYCAIFQCNNVPDTESILPSIFNQRTGRFLNSNEFVIENPVVITKSGPVEGYVTRTISNRPFYAFESIPYAETTAGVNRFRPPIPKAPWTEIFQAKRSDIKCLQYILYVFGQEDCLVLSIYTPKVQENAEGKQLPVIVFIHGGAFLFGAGTEYGPHYLLDENVIYVSINYRLGVLGFLSTGDDVVPGNNVIYAALLKIEIENGLKDQALAIKWISENIEAFGGDATRITLIGQSAGAVSTQLHMMSNVTRSLFSSAIAMSGSVFNVWGFHSAKVVENRKARLAHITGCTLSKGSRVFVDCLRNLNPYYLVERQRWIMDIPGFPVLFAPVVEPWNKDAFLTKTPEEHYRTGDVSKIPFITTITNSEANLFLVLHKAIVLYQRYLREFKQRLPIYMDYGLENEDRQEEITEMLSRFYLKGQDISSNEAALGQMMTDRGFAFPNRKSIQAHSALAPTYSYIFNMPTAQKSFAKLYSQDPEKWGSMHSDDFLYIFNYTLSFENWKKSDTDYSLVRLMCSMLANFAATREPYLLKDNKLVKIWEPVANTKNIRFLQISRDIKMIDDPFQERMQFWEEMNLTDMKPWFPK